MTRFNIEHVTDLSDCIYVEVDRRFNVAIHRTETAIELRVYPLTDGAIWDWPFTTFTVDEAEFADLENELLQQASEGGNQ